MPRLLHPSRRDLLKAGAAGAALTAFGGQTISRAFAAQLTAGFIYVGPKDDYGYNQAHAEGAAALKGIDGLTIVEEENVPETVDVQKTMELMINLDGATLIFPTSFGYFDPHMLAMAEKYPDIQFRHCGGLWTDKNPANTGSYFGYIGMGQYPERHRRRPHHEVEEDRFRRSKADPAGAPQHQLLHARRAKRRSDDHHAGYLHR